MKPLAPPLTPIRSGVALTKKGHLVEFLGREGIIRVYTWPYAVFEKTAKAPLWRSVRFPLKVTMRRRRLRTLKRMADEKKSKIWKTEELALADWLGRAPHGVLAAADGMHHELEPWFLSAATRCPEMMDLFQSTPALALMLSSLPRFRPFKRHGNTLRAVRSALATKNQPEMLRYLGFRGASRSTVRLLRKLPRHELIPGRLAGLRVLWNLIDAGEIHPAVVTTIRHLPELTSVGLWMLTHAPTRSMLAPQVQSDILRSRLHVQWELLGFLNACRHNRPEHDWYFTSMRQLEEEGAFEHAVLEIAPIPLVNLNDFVGVTFPKAIPPCEGMTQIRNLDQLRETARDFINCVLSHTPLLADGRCALYRLHYTHPITGSIEEACVMLQRYWTSSRTRLYEIAEIRGPRNARSSWELIAFVEHWREVSQLLVPFEDESELETDGSAAQLTLPLEDALEVVDGLPF